jgi:hypothetical protein
MRSGGLFAIAKDAIDAVLERLGSIHCNAAEAVEK